MQYGIYQTHRETTKVLNWRTLSQVKSRISEKLRQKEKTQIIWTYVSVEKEKASNRLEINGKGKQLLETHFEGSVLHNKT